MQPDADKRLADGVGG